MTKKLSPIKRNGRFYFDKDHKPESFLFGTIPSSIRSFMQRSFKMPKYNPTEWVNKHPLENHFIEPHITWLGHSTFLIQIEGINILTDPIFDRPAFIYPRVLPFGANPDQLPPIHAILISHNHRDHMDEASLLYLKKINNNKTHILVPLGDKKWFQKRGFTHIDEFEWEQELQIFNHEKTGSIICTFVPAHHWSQRGLFDKNRSLWGGWVIHTTHHQIYFAGDTAYSPECFSRIRHLFPSLHIALLPIGPGEPRSWMKHSHVDAHEAGQAFLEVNAQIMIPMHWGTFSFGNDHFHTPIVQIQEWWASNSHLLGEKQLVSLKVGERFSPTSKK